MGACIQSQRINEDTVVDIHQESATMSSTSDLSKKAHDKQTQKNHTNTHTSTSSIIKLNAPKRNNETNTTSTHKFKHKTTANHMPLYSQSIDSLNMDGDHHRTSTADLDLDLDADLNLNHNHDVLPSLQTILQHIPSESTSSTMKTTTTSCTIPNYLPSKPLSNALQPIHDDDERCADDHVANEIDDNHAVTYSDEVLEAMKTTSSGSEETDGSNRPEEDAEMNGKDEYDSDEHSKHDVSDDDDEHSEIHTDPEEAELDGNDLNQQQLIIDQLSDITYRGIQSAQATQAGTSNGKSKTNQDSLICLDQFGPSSIFQLYGVCDGHGPNGNNVSQFVAEQFPSILEKLLSNSLHSLSIPNILKKAFELIEDELTALQNEDKLTFDINYSGTTATVGFVAGNKLYVANIGDSRTVLGKIPPTANKKKHVPIAMALSTDHDPKNSTEVLRIKKTKSAQILFDDEDDSARIQIELPDIAEDGTFLTVSKSANMAVPDNDTKPKPNKHRRTQSLVKKISASVSRSIGDRMAHQYGGLISEPEITVHELADDDIFVIFASDGIWQMMDNDDVMRAVGTKLNACKEDAVYDDLQKTTSKLVREANISWQDEYEDYTDDITCVIVRIGKVS